MDWETVIGLEIHVQLNTASKIFSGSATAYGAEPNSQASAVDLGLPGVLPVLNENVVRKAIKFGLAVNAAISDYSVFARKNYFYPDLPKGYQISQYEHPIVGKGEIEIILADGSCKMIGITRAHLEEDAGKSVHDMFSHYTGVDLNRAGTPLIEIVSEPDMRSAAEAAAYMKTIHSLVRYLDISDGNMQEGSFRCDANVSVRPTGSDTFGTRAELKNLNSFRFVEQAVNYEVERQITLIEAGDEVIQETRLYDPNRGETRSMRGKEEAHDYRYFPDPDLLPVRLDKTYVDNIRAELPELPAAKRQRFIGDYGLGEEDSQTLTASRDFADYYEAAVKASGGCAKVCANTITVTLAGKLNKTGLDINHCPVSATKMGQMIARLQDNTISSNGIKTLLDALWEIDDDVDAAIEKLGIKQVTDTAAIEKLVDEVIAKCPDQCEQYRNGNDKVLGYLVGQVMKQSQGKANPQQVNELLRQKLAGK